MSLQYRSLLYKLTGSLFLRPAHNRERVWRAVHGRHVSAAGTEAPLWEDARSDDMYGQRCANVEDGQAVPSLQAGGLLHRVHGKNHWTGECLFSFFN